MRMREAAKRLTPVLLTAALLGGCSSTPPHSDYFMVPFVPGTPAPSETGLSAINGAINAAKRTPPTFIIIDGAVAPGTAEPTLEKERADAVFAAFAKAGVDTRRIKVELRPSSEKGYEERKDSLIVQLAYGS